MTNLIRGVAMRLSALVMLTHVAAAEATEIKVLSALALKPVLDDLGPNFERATGHKLAFTFGPLGEALKHVRAGESFDVAILPRQGIATLVQDGKAVAGQMTVFARSGIGVAIRSGAPKPDISTPEAFKRALLAAKSITYTDPKHGGSTSPHIVKVIERLGIASELKPKTIFPESAGLAVAAMVANGQAEIGLQQIQELVNVAGIEIVGPFPGELQNNLVFEMTVMAAPQDSAASKSLIGFLQTPEAAAVVKAKGLEPN